MMQRTCNGCNQPIRNDDGAADAFLVTPVFNGVVKDDRAVRFDLCKSCLHHAGHDPKNRGMEIIKGPDLVKDMMTRRLAGGSRPKEETKLLFADPEE